MSTVRPAPARLVGPVPFPPGAPAGYGGASAFARRVSRRRTYRRPRLGMAAAVGVLSTVLAGCGGAATADTSGSGHEVTVIRYQGSVGQVTFPELAADLGYLPGLRLSWAGNTISGPQDIQSTATGAIDIGGAFNGAIVKLVAAGAPIQAVVGYYGADAESFIGYYTLAGSPIRGARDLIGKKVGMNTLGAHAEAVLDQYLTKGGLTPAEIKQVVPTVLPPVNTEQALRAHQIDVAALSGVIRDKAVAHGGLSQLTSDYALLGPFTAGSLVLRKDFIAQNPNTTRVLVSGIARAIRWSQTQPRSTVVARFTRIIQQRHRQEDTSLVGLWKSSGVAEPGGVIRDRDFTPWIDWLRQTGQLSRDVAAAQVYSDAYNSLAAGGSR